MIVRFTLRVCAIVVGVLLLWLLCHEAFGQCPGGVCPARQPVVVAPVRPLLRPVVVVPVVPLPEPPALVIAPRPAPVARAVLPPHRHGRRVYVLVPQVK